jgi:hypothetical protein
MMKMLIPTLSPRQKSPGPTKNREGIGWKSNIWIPMLIEKSEGKGAFKKASSDVLFSSHTKPFIGVSRKS